MTHADRLAFRWLIAEVVLLVAGTLAFGYFAIAQSLDSRLPHDQALQFGLEDAAGNSLAFLIPGAIISFVGFWLIRQPPSAWRRLFLLVAAGYLLWSDFLTAGGIGVFLVPSAVCAMLSALLGNGV